jgi:hypothetical protein
LFVAEHAKGQIVDLGPGGFIEVGEIEVFIALGGFD